MQRFDTLVTVTMLAIFVTMVALASTYPAGARFMPYVIGIPAIGLCLLQLVLDLRRSRRPAAATRTSQIPDETHDANDGPPDVAAELKTWAYFVLFVGGVLLFGFLVCVPILVTVYLWREAKVRPLVALASGCGFTLAIHLMFERLLTFRLHGGFATEWLLDRLGS